MRRAGRLKVLKVLLEGIGKVLTPGRLVTHCLVQLGDYLALQDLWVFNWSQEEAK